MSRRRRAAAGPTAAGPPVLTATIVPVARAVPTAPAAPRGYRASAAATGRSSRADLAAAGVYSMFWAADVDYSGGPRALARATASEGHESGTRETDARDTAR